MARINDRTRSVFSEADKTILRNFTAEETKQINELAEKLRVILEAAKRRNLAAPNPRRQFSRDLTKRQRDIVQLFAEGRPMKQIAAILDLSTKTVEFHKHHIMEAFSVKSNADLVLFALKRGLITVDPELLSAVRTAH